jgi:hypothetical protein
MEHCLPAPRNSLALRLDPLRRRSRIRKGWKTLQRRAVRALATAVELLCEDRSEELIDGRVPPQSRAIGRRTSSLPTMTPGSRITISASVPLSERPDPVRNEHTHRHQRNRREVSPHLARAGRTVEKQDEQARRDGTGRLDGDVEDTRPRRIARAKRPAPVEDVAVYRANSEPECCRRYVRRANREQEPVSNEAKHCVRYADNQEARELA